MLPITPEMIFGTINFTKSLLENAPAVVNAANHVITKGIHPGGTEVIKAAVGGIMENAGSLSSAGDIGRSAFGGLQSTFQGSGSLTADVGSLFKNTKARFVPSKPVTPAGSVSETLQVKENLNHGITESAAGGASSALSSIGSATVKGGLAGIAIGVTMESVNCYMKYRKGEMTKEECAKEIMKSGGQMGITGAATAGITTALSIPLAAAGLASAPVTVPISIVLGAAINKIVAPAFGRGDYQKLLGEAKYYQNLMYAHDDLVLAIERSEQQFAGFIEEYQHQMQVHAQLTDTNRQLNQLHQMGNQRLLQQKEELSSSFAALGDLYDNI